MTARSDVLSVVLCDLAGEGAWLDAVVAGLDESGWLDIAQAFAGPPGAGREPAGSS